MFTKRPIFRAAIFAVVPAYVLVRYFTLSFDVAYGEIATADAVGAKVRMIDSTRAAGISHRSLPAELPPALRHLPFVAEYNGAGIAVADFDRDGWMDFYVTSPRAGTPNALYHNNHDGTFTDVAPAMGLANISDHNLAANAALWFDADGDGWPDLLVVGTGCPRLFRNVEGKRFERVPFGPEGGSDFCADTQGAIAFDYDRDGKEDVYLVNHSVADWRNAMNGGRILLPSARDAPIGPASQLFHNLGNGKFEEVAAAAGVSNNRWGFAAVADDFNGDGFPDLFVANDFGKNQLYRNTGGQAFTNPPASRMFPGTLSREGMNAEAADLFGDGRLSIFVTKISQPGYVFGRNELWVYEPGRDTYENKARDLGLSSCGWGWGSVFLDAELRGELDLIVANGLHSGKRGTSYWFPAGSVLSTSSRFYEDPAYWPPMGEKDWSGHQRSCFFHNTGDRFVNISASLGWTNDLDSRSVALIDFDNNGTQDVLVSSINGPLKLFRNARVSENSWVGFRLLGRSGGDAAGARLKLAYVDENGEPKSRVETVHFGSGFASQSDPRLVFGLGKGAPRSFEIHWPDGRVTTQNGGFRLNEYSTVRE